MVRGVHKGLRGSTARGTKRGKTYLTILSNLVKSKQATNNKKEKEPARVEQVFDYKDNERPAKAEKVTNDNEDQTVFFKEEQGSPNIFKPNQPRFKNAGR